MHNVKVVFVCWIEVIYQGYLMHMLSMCNIISYLIACVYAVTVMFLSTSTNACKATEDVFVAFFFLFFLRALCLLADYY